MLKKAVFVIVLLGLLTIGVWYVGIPDQYVKETIERVLVFGGVSPLKERRLNVSLEGFGKDPLFGFHVKRAVIRRGETEVFSIVDLRGRIDILSLLRMTPGFNLRGDVAGGWLALRVTRSGGGMQLSFKLKGAQVEKLEAVRVLKALKGSGVLDVKGIFDIPVRANDLKGVSGEVLLSIKNMKFRDVFSGSIYLPLSLFSRMRASIRMKGGELGIEALSMEGKDIYSRLKGAFRGLVFKGALEVMPGPGFPEGMLTVIQRYRESPGYYRIPLRGSVARLM